MSDEKPQDASEGDIEQSASTAGLGVEGELIAFECICADLLSVNEENRARILKAVAILLGLGCE